MHCFFLDHSPEALAELAAARFQYSDADRDSLQSAGRDVGDILGLDSIAVK